MFTFMLALFEGHIRKGEYEAAQKNRLELYWDTKWPGPWKE